MIFCTNCFTDFEIKARIEHLSEEEANTLHQKGDCPVCGSRDVYLYDTETRTSLNDVFESLLGLYTPENNLPFDFPEKEKKRLCRDFKENWNLFNQNLSEPVIESIIKATNKIYCEKNPDVLTKKVGIINFIDKQSLAEHSLVKTNIWDDFVSDVKTKNRFHTNIINETILRKYCSFLEKKYKKGDMFYRGRISKATKNFTIDEMGAPSFEFAKAGRANAEGISHLYLAKDERTTIYEVRAGAFDIISVGTFELQRDILVVDFQKLDKIYPFAAGINLVEYAINIEHLRKMNQEMSKTLRRNDSFLDYVPTQYIADYIKSFQDENTFESLYRGIEYQSTMNKEGYNLVAFYPNDFKCIDVKSISITNIQYEFN